MKNNIIVKLMGGLGNQMFEYAFGQARSTDTLYDLSWFDEPNTVEGLTKWDFALDCFNLNLKTASIEEVNKLKEPKKTKIPGFFRKLFNIAKYRSYIIYESKANVFEPELLKKEGYFDGYFQSEKYFKNIRKKLLKDFSLKTPLNEENQKMLDKIKNTPNSVSLHVRRGDYVNLSQIHLLCGLDYYQKAVDIISSKIENPHFFIFSDDTDWVIENLKINYPFDVVNINSKTQGYFDLELMKNCKHNIIANSSFSWWGAWLNENLDKIIIAPLKWHKDNQNKEWDIFPDDWLVI